MKTLKLFVIGLLAMGSLCTACDDEHVMSGVISFETGIELDTTRVIVQGSNSTNLFNETLAKLRSLSGSAYDSWSETYVGMDSLKNVIERNVPILERVTKRTLTKIQKEKDEFDKRLSSQDWGAGSFKIGAYASYYYDGSPDVVVLDSIIFKYPAE